MPIKKFCFACIFKGAKQTFKSYLLGILIKYGSFATQVFPPH